MKRCGIYLLTHVATGRKYVGQSIDIDKRLEDHRWHVKGTRLSHAIHKYGWRAFTAEVIHICHPEELDALEVAYIASHDSISPRGFNLKPGGSQTPHSEETKQKIGNAQRGRKHTQARIEKIRAALIGRIVSPETRAKLSARAKARMSDKAQRLYLSRINTGKRHSDEARAKMSASRTGIKQRPETIAKRAAAATGAKRSEQTRAKLSALAIRRLPTRLRGPSGRFL